MRVADYIIERLYSKGVKHIFMVTGRGILFLSDAVARHKKIKSICTHHEQAAAFAAMAYAQYNENIGACLVSIGCAATNAITGLLCAWQDKIPCVFISGQNKLTETTRYTKMPIRTFGQQETDIISIVESITKYAVMITDPNEIVYELDKAIYLAHEGKRGPVWIDVPLDIQNMRIEPEQLKRFNSEDISSFEPSTDEAEYSPTVVNNSKSSIASIKVGTATKEDKVDLYYLSDCLSEMLPENAVLLTDAGLEELIIPSNVKFTKSQRCIHPISQGSMGYALPGAIGAYYASNKDIVAVIGDGSIMMNLQELQTINYNKIPVKIIVINNNMYATIRNRQTFLFRTRTIGTDPSNGVSCPDFKKIAECFELSYMKIESSCYLRNRLQIVFNTGGPVLCEIMGIENQEYH